VGAVAAGRFRRWATLTDPSHERVGATYELPQLANLDNLVEAAIRQRPVPMSVRGQPPMGSDDVAETAENRTENFGGSETSFPASESGFTISEANFSVEEIAQIAAMIAVGGKGKPRWYRRCRVTRVGSIKHTGHSTNNYEWLSVQPQMCPALSDALILLHSR